MPEAASHCRIGVLGATSLVGTCLLPLLTQAGWPVTAFSRRAVGPADDGVTWQQVSASSSGILPDANAPAIPL